MNIIKTVGEIFGTDDKSPISINISTDELVDLLAQKFRKEAKVNIDRVICDMAYCYFDVEDFLDEDTYEKEAIDVIEGFDTNFDEAYERVGDYINDNCYRLSDFTFERQLDALQSIYDEFGGTLEEVYDAATADGAWFDEYGTVMVTGFEW